VGEVGGECVVVGGCAIFGYGNCRLAAIVDDLMLQRFGNSCAFGLMRCNHWMFVDWHQRRDGCETVSWISLLSSLSESSFCCSLRYF